MKVNRGISIAVVALSVGIMFSACKKKEEQVPTTSAPAQQAQETKSVQQLVISKFGPDKTKSGKVFNKQPDGSSAFWFNGENITLTTVVVLNGTNLKSAPYKDGKTITAGPVPNGLFSTPGSYPIYLLDTKTGSKSNEMKFIVE